MATIEKIYRFTSYVRVDAKVVINFEQKKVSLSKETIGRAYLLDLSEFSNRTEVPWEEIAPTISGFTVVITPGVGVNDNADASCIDWFIGNGCTVDMYYSAQISPYIKARYANNSKVRLP
jgi:hypothetical protein